MTTPYGGNDPQQWGGQQPQWGQQPGGEQQWGQQPGYPQSGPQPQQYPPSGPQPQQPAPDQWGQQWQQPAQQQPQYEQQWQQPAQPQTQYQQYPGYSPYPSFEDGEKKSKAWLWITLTVVALAIAAVAVLGFWKPGFFNTKVFDNASLEEGVVQISKEKFGVEATNVSCPDDIKVENGATGECTATVNGEQKKVPITVTNADADPPEYRVDQPR